MHSCHCTIVSGMQFSLPTACLSERMIWLSLWRSYGRIACKTYPEHLYIPVWKAAFVWHSGCINFLKSRAMKAWFGTHEAWTWLLMLRHTGTNGWRKVRSFAQNLLNCGQPRSSVYFLSAFKTETVCAARTIAARKLRRVSLSFWIARLPAAGYRRMITCRKWLHALRQFMQSGKPPASSIWCSLKWCRLPCSCVNKTVLMYLFRIYCMRKAMWRSQDRSYWQIVLQ